MTISYEAAQAILNRQDNKLTFIKDKSSIYLDANVNFLSCFGLQYKEDIFQKTDHELPSKVYAEKYIENDLEAISSGESQSFEPILKYNTGTVIVLSYKYIFHDPTKHCDCIVGTSEFINYEKIKKAMLLFEYNESFPLGVSTPLFKEKANQHAKPPLTNRELDVLYYILHGLAQKQIAAKLNLSVRTVEDYIDNVKSKLQCHHKHQLFEFAFQCGLMKIIPQKLLNDLS